jgi:hypothetical protein
LGRFTQADTIVTGCVQGFDRYSYVSNNPIRNVDPSGHNCGEYDLSGHIQTICNQADFWSDPFGPKGKEVNGTINIFWDYGFKPEPTEKRPPWKPSGHLSADYDINGHIVTIQNLDKSGVDPQGPSLSVIPSSYNPAIISSEYESGIINTAYVVPPIVTAAIDITEIFSKIKIPVISPITDFWGQIGRDWNENLSVEKRLGRALLVTVESHYISSLSVLSGSAALGSSFGNPVFAITAYGGTSAILSYSSDYLNENYLFKWDLLKVDYSE